MHNVIEDVICCEKEITVSESVLSWGHFEEKFNLLYVLCVYIQYVQCRAGWVLLMKKKGIIGHAVNVLKNESVL